jgi:hypothetical protein
MLDIAHVIAANFQDLGEALHEPSIVALIVIGPVVWGAAFLPRGLGRNARKVLAILFRQPPPNPPRD